MAEKLFSESLRIAESLEISEFKATSLCHLAKLQYRRGELDSALETFEDARKLVAVPSTPPTILLAEIENGTSISVSSRFRAVTVTSSMKISSASVIGWSAVGVAVAVAPQVRTFKQNTDTILAECSRKVSTTVAAGPAVVIVGEKMYLAGVQFVGIAVGIVRRTCWAVSM